MVFSQANMASIIRMCQHYVFDNTHAAYQRDLMNFMNKQGGLVIYPNPNNVPSFTFAGKVYYNPQESNGKSGVGITRNLHPTLAKDFVEFLDSYAEYVHLSSALKSYLNRVFLLIKNPFEFLDVVPEQLIHPNVTDFINDPQNHFLKATADESTISLFKKMNAGIEVDLKVYIFKRSLME